MYPSFVRAPSEDIFALGCNTCVYVRLKDRAFFVYVPLRIPLRFILDTTSATLCPPQSWLRDYRMDVHQVGVRPELT